MPGETEHVGPVIPIERAEVFFDGIFSEPRLAHPEGVAVDAEGAVWCGTERGEVLRVAPDGADLELVASTGGFILGIALDGEGSLYACDLRHSAVFKVAVKGGEPRPLPRGDGGSALRTPNFPVVDRARNCLYVSDSTLEGGPSIWRYDLDSGAASVWYQPAMRFANGLALSPDGSELYVAETFASRVVRLPIGANGCPGEPSVLVEGIRRLPDGLAVDRDGRVYVACYEPSRIYRVQPGGGHLELLVDDPEAHTLCHPTNCAFRGTDLFTANLGRWHLTRIPVGTEGLPLPA